MGTNGMRWLAGSMALLGCASGTAPAARQATVAVRPRRITEALPMLPSTHVDDQDTAGLGVPLDDEVIEAVDVRPCGTLDDGAEAYLAGGGRVALGAVTHAATGTSRGLRACARIERSWLFVGRDGAVFTSSSFLGDLQPAGGAPIGATAEVFAEGDHALARTEDGRLFVIDASGARPTQGSPARVFAVSPGDGGLVVALAEPAVVAWSSDGGLSWSRAVTPPGTAPLEASRRGTGMLVRFGDRTLALRPDGSWSALAAGAPLAVGGGPRAGGVDDTMRARVAQEALRAGVVVPAAHPRDARDTASTWRCQDTDASGTWADQVEFAYRMPAGALRLGQNNADGRSVEVEYWLGALDGRHGLRVVSSLPLPVRNGQPVTDDVAVDVVDAGRGSGLARLCAGQGGPCAEALLTPAGAVTVRPTLDEALHGPVDVLEAVHREGGGADLLIGERSSAGLYQVVDIGHDGTVHGQVAAVARLADTHPAIVRDGTRVGIGLVTAEGATLALRSGRWVGGGLMAPEELAHGAVPACGARAGRELVVHGVDGAPWAFGTTSAPTPLYGAQALALHVGEDGACVSRLEAHAHNQWTVLRPEAGGWSGMRAMGTTVASIRCDPRAPRDPAGD